MFSSVKLNATAKYKHFSCKLFKVMSQYNRYVCKVQDTIVYKIIFSNEETASSLILYGMVCLFNNLTMATPVRLKPWFKHSLFPKKMD